jgi:hypothetical protein
MDINTTWAQHHGPAAVEALITAHPDMFPDQIRRIANTWHATDNLPGWLDVIAGGAQRWAELYAMPEEA